VTVTTSTVEPPPAVGQPEIPKLTDREATLAEAGGWEGVLADLARDGRPF
jgi:hypothetical protein